MNRFRCPACGGEQYTACDTAKDCIYCGNEVLEKAEIREYAKVILDMAKLIAPVSFTEFVPLVLKD